MGVESLTVFGVFVRIVIEITTLLIFVRAGAKKYFRKIPSFVFALNVSCCISSVLVVD